MGNLVVFIAMELTLHILNYISFILNPFFKVKKVKRGNKDTPIVLLHGWMARSLSLIVLKKRLEKLGYSVYIPDFGYNLGRVEDLAGKLDRYIKSNGIRDFILIGHSMGGLLGLYYYQNYKHRIVKLISLGCPFHGTNVARLAFFSESAKQMMPGSDFIKKLHKKNVRKDRFYVIESKHDHITSIRSGHLKNAHNIKLKYIGHMSLVFSKEVFEEVKKILYFYG